MLGLRLAFLFVFAETGNAETSDVLKAFGIGARFDFRLAIFLTAPLVLLSIFPAWNLVSSQVCRSISFFYSLFVLALVLIVYILDFGHYAYLGIRIDSTVLRFFEDVNISSRMVWESYPVIWICLSWLTVLGLHAVTYRKISAHILLSSGLEPNWKAKTIAVSLVLFIGIVGYLGRYSLVPLRWNHAFFNGDPHVAAIGLNPALYFIDTFQFREPPYNLDNVEEYYPDISSYLGMGNSDKFDVSAPNYLRRHQRRDHAIVAKGERPPNVIFIMLESLGASRLGIYGNPLQPTPVMDQIARSGWFFKNFYVPVSGTSKTVFASVTGLPDVSSVATATRNPFISEQHTIINAFKDHKKYYFIGGSAGWANMGALIKRSIDGVTLFQEGDYSAPVVDVWGISDLDLFREANARFVQIPDDQPFFAIIQTAGNHRPFTIPEDNEGFEGIDLPVEELNRWGFKSAAQFNAVRLLDHNLGLFFEMAKTGGYFDNTIFVFYGDHNNRITSTPHMAPFFEALDLDGLHVPHMIYGPAFIKGKVINEAVSLVDVLPTVAGLLGVDYVNTSMGRDINIPFNGKERLVFTQTSSKRYPVIGVIGSEFMLRMNFDGSEAKLHDLLSDTPETDMAQKYPAKAEYMTRLAMGIYETTKYMHHHNPPQRHRISDEPASNAEELEASAKD